MSLRFPLSLLAPAVLLVAAAIILAGRGLRLRPRIVLCLSEASALTALALASAGLVQVVIGGPVQVSAMDGPFVVSPRGDAISATMVLLVAFIGWIVMRFSRTYMDGEAEEVRFHGLMLATLAAAPVLMQAGSLSTLVLGGIGVGAGLRQLLLFYPERAAARRAAAKFTLVWGLGDAALIVAAVILVATFGSGDFTALADTAADGLPLAGHLAIALVVLAAALKTAAFPMHGWLTEVMEAPTPVSALLHAGIINAGGFMLIRTADLVQMSSGAMAALVMIGGLTALFGAVVMLTQSAIKTALARSTVGQIGFMLLQCGLGLWPLALLHIVAHSMYKAHAFLSAGGAVKAVAGLRRPGPVAVPRIGAALKSFALALMLYAVVAALFMLVFGPKTAQALALGAILVFGVAYLVAQGLADSAPAPLTRRIACTSLGAAAAYFTFQIAAEKLWGPALPAAPAPGPLEWAMIVLAVVSFGLVALAQMLLPLWAHHPATAGLRVHLANGHYLNALLDRLIGGFRVARSK
ncbi:MAG: oxidoreductase [Alphaproteobacteria bacterium]|nr:oxidoreductase [Alphaproteobacteria bacterium]